MEVLITLGKIIGPKIAETVFNGLINKPKGPELMEKVNALIQRGATTVEALKKVFGHDFIQEMNNAIGFGAESGFSYEAGIKSYIIIEDDVIQDPIKLLRDELNINLDRLSILSGRDPQILNLFKGLMSVLQSRFREKVSPNNDNDDIKVTFSTIDAILSGREKNFKEMYRTLSSTALGSVGALLIISGAMIATTTGVGIVTAITTFIFGVPLLTVGALVIPGALLVLLAAKNLKPRDNISISIGLAYKLLERASVAETNSK